MDVSIRRANILGALCVAIPLLVAFRLWSFSYFWGDDFNNIYWIQFESASNLLRHIVDPRSTFFRPVGMLFYWMVYHWAGLSPVPYHLVAWTLHSINTALLFLLLRYLVRSPFAAAAGTIPFAFRVNFADLYWSFGTIFELVACGFMLLGIYWYVRYRPSWLRMIGLTAIYVLAIKSKEMAITLPVVWLLYDLCLRRRIQPLLFILPALTAWWFTALRVATMRGTRPTDVYFISVHWRTAVDGLGQYFAWLYGVELPAWTWCLSIVVAIGVFSYLRERLLLFFLSYTLLTFLPVVFLTNHRWPYFWYIPFIGISGLFAAAARRVEEQLRWRLPLRRVVVTNVALLIAWSGAHSSVEYIRSARTRAYQASLAEGLRTFVSGVEQISPEENATLYFVEIPPHFDLQVLNTSIQVVLNRRDLHAEVVSAFPRGARWKLRFSQGRLERLD